MLHPFRSLGCSHHMLPWQLTKWLHYRGKIAASGSSFLFFSAPTQHVTGFIMQLRQIQVRQSVGNGNWPISVSTTLNASKSMERF